MNLKELNKPVDINDIEFRIQSINKGKYATILAYKNARYDMNILDNVIGAHLWQKDYKVIDGNLYCGVGIKTGEEWVWKWDVGTESMSDKEKGQASDSFKRACFCWGIGRELYDFPLIQVRLNDNELQESDGKFKASFGLKLKEWKWDVKRDDNNKIISLIASDENNNIRFDSSKKSAPKPPENKAEEPAHWLNLFTKSGEKTKAFISLEKAITEGKEYTLTGIRKQYKVSKDVAKQLLDNFNIS